MYQDAGNDGVKGAGEAGIPGVTVTLTGTNDLGQPVTLVKTTDANGFYEFTGLRPGTYTVTETQPGAYLDGKDTAGSTGGTVANDVLSAITLTAGANSVNNNFGELLPASLGNRLWLDADSDGQQDLGESGVVGATVTLIGGGADGVINGIGDTVATTTTGTNGEYRFNNLNAGEQYQVQFAAPTGTVFTQANVSGNTLDAVDSDANIATGKTQIVTLAQGEYNDTLDAGVIVLRPGIDIEKTTSGSSNTNGTAANYDNEDTANGVGVPVLTIGSDVTWTYKVTNTGNTSFTRAEVSIVDDNGSVGNTADDMTIANGKVVYQSGDDGDNVLEAGESWIYQATGTVQSLGGTGSAVTVDFSGNTATDGTDGNIRTYTAGDVTVQAGAWSRDKGTGQWAKAYLGAYGGGLGVTDSSEGTGNTDSTHTVDNTGRDNYIVFQFSKDVVIDKAYLGYVVGDSDIQVWIGNANGPITSMSNSVLSGMGFTEVNTTGSNAARWADVNAGGASGNVLIIAADTTDVSPEDYFKLEQLTLQAVQTDGVYANKATVTVTGGLSDSDMSHYTVQAAKASLGDRIWYDKNANGVQDSGEAGVAGVTLDLYNGANVLVATTTTNATGNYLFANLTAGDYHVDVREGTLPAGFIFTSANQGVNDAVDSDVRAVSGQPLSWGIMDNTTLSAGENDMSWDAGVYKVGIDVEKYVSSTTCVTVNNGCGEGANVSYWKGCRTWQSSLGDYGWSNTGCKSSTSYNQVFGVNCTGGTQSIWQVLCSTGTTAREVFMRESVAAYLNACHSSVDYAYSKAQVCEQTKVCINTANYDSTCKSYERENAQGCNWTTTKTNWNSTVDTQLYDADAPPGLEVKIGSTVTFTYIVKNTGDTALSNVVLTDDRIATVTYVSGDTDGDGKLDTNESWTYRATEVAQSGTIKNTATVTATDSVGGVAKVTDQDDAYYTGNGAAKSSLGDRVWEDKDADGIQDAGEAGIAGVKVTLKGAGKDGVFGTADDITAVTTTNANGNYEFNNLDAGKYTVNFGTLNGYKLTKADQGTVDAADSDANAVTGTTGVITLGANEHNLTVDAGMYRLASVGDKVWQDSNHNWVQDAGEAGIGGVKVQLLNAAGTTVLATTTTNSTGNYVFSNLDPGSYILQFDKSNVMYLGVNMNNWKWGVKDYGSNDAIDSDVTGDGQSYTNVTRTSVFSLSSGQNDMTRDAAITPIVIDLDGNGIQTISRDDATAGFDLFGNGSAIKSGWISGGDGFLAVDKNGNGQVDSINELFGGTAKGAGFANLASYDSNSDGLVNDADAAFGQLMIWRDLNGNHATDAGELMSLAQAGVASLVTAFTELPQVDAQGNLHLERSSATMSDGMSVAMTDVYFNVSAEDAAAAGVTLPTISDLLGNDSSLDGLLGAAPAAVGAGHQASADVSTTGCDSSEALRRLAALSQESCHMGTAA